MSRLELTEFSFKLQYPNGKLLVFHSGHVKSGLQEISNSISSRQCVNRDDYGVLRE